MSFEQFVLNPTLTPARLVAILNQSGTYFNGPTNNGVGATFTYATGATTIDGVTPNVGDRILFVNQSSALQNGIYVVTQAGATGISLTLQRSSDFQNIEQMFEGQYVSVSAGSVNAGATYTLVEPFPAKIGVSNINFNGTITSGLGTAATKAASDNTQPTVASVEGSTVAGHLLQAFDTAGSVQGSGLVAIQVLTSPINNPDVSIDLIAFDTIVTAAALASGGSVSLLTSSGSKQYKLRILQLNVSGVNFSGGGGDRLGQITDGTTVYTVIPAASLQTQVNSGWGSTALPFPASNMIDTSTAAGANLVFKYSGGTTDYSTGTVVMSGIAQRVA